MFWLGKFLGSIFGFLIAGPVGVIVGLLLGHYFDLSRKGPWLEDQGPHVHTQAQDLFFQATFAVMGYIAKADGRVSESEIRVAESIMKDMLLTPELRREAIHFFNLGKQPEFVLNTVLNELKTASWYQRQLLALFIEIQVRAAHAEGRLTATKRSVLEYICSYLGFDPRQFFYHTYNEQRYSYNHTTPRPRLETAYQTLGVASTVSNNDLKKAYRKLMSQHHPDKLVSKGLPEEMLKLATQKTQEIKSAYESICEARGI